MNVRWDIARIIDGNVEQSSALSRERDLQSVLHGLKRCNNGNCRSKTRALMLPHRRRTVSDRRPRLQIVGWQCLHAT